MRPFTLHPRLASLLAVLPQYPHSLAFAKMLNLTLADTLRCEALLPLHDKLICLQINDARITLYFTLNKRGLTAKHAGNTADLIIRANAYDFLSLAMRKEDPDTLFTKCPTANAEEYRSANTRIAFPA